MSDDTWVIQNNVSRCTYARRYDTRLEAEWAAVARSKKVRHSINVMRTDTSCRYSSYALHGVLYRIDTVPWQEIDTVSDPD